MVAPIRSATRWETGFDAIIDVRSPNEYAEDHIPGAINLPVLSNDERAEVGTIYKQVSPFEARKLGARLAAANIARHIEAELGSLPASWAPLVYCWRGGQRSGSMARILAEIGWVVTLLEGGYKSYRRQITEELDNLPLNLVLLQGATGSAKTRILHAVADLGGQVLDLEGLAAHRGSLLGAEPGQDQPGQRYFESLLYQAMRQLDPSRPVLVEAESSRIGQCHLPKPLWRQMQSAPQIRVEASVEARVDFLKRDYAHIIAEPEVLEKLVGGMVFRHGHDVCNEWRRFIADANWDGLVTALITDHYDPAYQGSAKRRQGADFGVVTASSLQPEDFPKLANDILKLMNHEKPI